MCHPAFLSKFGVRCSMFDVPLCLTIRVPFVPIRVTPPSSKTKITKRTHFVILNYSLTATVYPHHVRNRHKKRTHFRPLTSASRPSFASVQSHFQHFPIQPSCPVKPSQGGGDVLYLYAALRPSLFPRSALPHSAFPRPCPASTNSVSRATLRRDVNGIRFTARRALEGIQPGLPRV